MAVMRTSDHPELLDTPLRKIFFLAVEAVPAEYSEWINIFDTDRAFEDDLRMSEFGVIGELAEGGSVAFQRALEGSTKRYEPIEFAGGFLITQKMRETDQHGVMARMTEALRRSFRHLFETEAYKILNNSTSTTTDRMKGFDGLSLLSTAHTMLKPGVANQANRPTTDATISQSALEAAVKKFHAWTDETGKPGYFIPSLAIVDTSDQFLAAKLLKNATRYDTANREENWVKQGPDSNGVSRFIASRYFTASNQWFLLSAKSMHDLNLAVRIQPQFETHIEFASGNFQVKGRASLISTFGRWFGVYGSKGY